MDAAFTKVTLVIVTQLMVSVHEPNYTLMNPENGSSFHKS